MPFNEKGEFIRARRPATKTCDTDLLSRDDLLTVAKGFGALVLLAGLIWFVLVFREWIAITFGFWVVSNLRSWLR